jgi:hypothetical protein
MITSLAEALDNVELECGRIYRCRVREFWVELRVLSDVDESGPTLIPESDIRLDAWTELPTPSGGVLVRAHWGPPDSPDLPDIPAEAEQA